MPPMGVQEEIQSWGMHANCYAYAFKCPTPSNGNRGGAWPGHQAAHAGRALPMNPTWIDKVVADGGGAVTALPNQPDNPPADVNGTYLVAMMANNAGFHFIRKDSTLGRWHWKDGNMGSVKFNIFDNAVGDFIYVRDTHLNDLLVARRAGFRGWYPHLPFVSFFRVPDRGMEVRRT